MGQRRWADDACSSLTLPKKEYYKKIMTMKATYVNPEVKNTNMRIRASLLSGSSVAVDNTGVSGSGSAPIEAGAKSRAGVSSLD